MTILLTIGTNVENNIYHIHIIGNLNRRTVFINAADGSVSGSARRQRKHRR